MHNLTGRQVLLLGTIDSRLHAVAQVLHQSGAHITVGREAATTAAATVLAQSVHGSTLLLEGTEPEQLQLALAAAPELDALIIAPQRFLYKPFIETTDAEWEVLLRGNFERALWCAQAFAHHLSTHGRPGQIIFLSSVAAHMPFTHTSAWGTSLGTLRALAKMAAVDLGPQDITVNVIECGWMESEVPELYLQESGLAHILAGTPTGRLVTAEELGHCCAFLLSTYARSITGHILTVDGGYTLTRSAGQEPLLMG
jgi:NAD(P)-dependent dehydrogenase (short-subunit alcohol dehydrogenase family)